MSAFQLGVALFGAGVIVLGALLIGYFFVHRQRQVEKKRPSPVIWMLLGVELVSLGFLPFLLGTVGLFR